jgi:hypothetical protein
MKDQTNLSRHPMVLNSVRVGFDPAFGLWSQIATSKPQASDHQGLALAYLAATT